MKWPISLALVVGAASAQTVNVTHLHETSMRAVEYYAAAYRVPVELVEAIIDEESGWNPYAISSKGAVGIMQLMPQTAIRFAVHNRFRVDENIRGGVAYLAWLGSERGSPATFDWSPRRITWEKVPSALDGLRIHLPMFRVT